MMNDWRRVEWEVSAVTQYIPDCWLRRASSFAVSRAGTDSGLEMTCQVEKKSCHRVEKTSRLSLDAVTGDENDND
ncbi:hypothetical protein pipiens_011882 [Culex pipiens pipiens]|uniref:Uncharacterized protein n=1 Tax=Culex pipiens pipiens TaxID=38569 RepID=A0ABD1D4K5_CULPP